MIGCFHARYVSEGSGLLVFLLRGTLGFSQSPKVCSMSVNLLGSVIQVAKHASLLGSQKKPRKTAFYWAAKILKQRMAI